MSNQKNSDPMNIEMETLKDLKNFIESMDDNAVGAFTYLVIRRKKH